MTEGGANDVWIAFEPKAAFVELRHFYESVDYHGGIADDCTVLSARVDGEPVGLVRLAEEVVLLMLREMMIAPDWQRRGVGKRMLTILSDEIGARECYLLGLPWLEGFYGEIGFLKIADEDAAARIAEQARQNRANGHEQIVVRRPPRGETVR